MKAKILETPIQEEFERITRLAKRLFNVPIVAISLVEDRRQWFKSIQGLDVSETCREVSFCGHAILQEGVLIVPDTHLDPRFHDNPLVTGNPYIRFYAGCPIKSPRGYKYGTICLIDTISRELSKEDIFLLQDIGALVETEILKQGACTAQEKIIQHLDQAKLASMVDPLTRLWNRDGMINILNNQLEEFGQTGKRFGIGLLDIDDFKSINDNFGHDVGDVVLRSLSKFLVRLTRDKDAVSRWGGEEFLMLINDPDKHQVHKIAERIRKRIEKHPIIINDKHALSLTVTVGLTMYNDDVSLRLEDFIKQADQAMYKGKNLGRNQVVVL